VENGPIAAHREERTPMSKIVVDVDGSEESARALA